MGAPASCSRLPTLPNSSKYPRARRAGKPVARLKQRLDDDHQQLLRRHLQRLRVRQLLDHLVAGPSDC